MRTASAPDTISGAQTSLQTDRMAIGWKPQLARSKTQIEAQMKAEAALVLHKPVGIARSSSVEALIRFSSEGADKTIDLKARVAKDLPFRKSRSADALVVPSSTVPEKVEVEKTRVLHSERRRRLTLDEVKNKPLPRIAML